MLLQKFSGSSQTITHTLSKLAQPADYSVEDDSEDEDKDSLRRQNKHDRHLWIQFLSGDLSDTPEEDDSEVSVDEPPRHYSR